VSEPSSIAPVRRSVTVSASPTEAYAFFTREMGSWWPLSTHSIDSERSRSVTFGAVVGDRIIETMDDGSQEVWGTVTELSPPSRIAFSWHPGRSPDAVTRVEVTFTASGDHATIVELVHSDWESWDDGAAQSDGYREGWVPVLQAFVDEIHIWSAK
jgi:uncharacterized protein YndB with AHSA1/START domain